MSETESTKTLLLVPTQLELDHVSDRLTDRFAVEICGFGPIASGIRTSQLLATGKYRQVILLGIAGTYDPTRLPVGQATTFAQVGCYGVGSGGGPNFQLPSELGFPQLTIGNEKCFEALQLAECQAKCEAEDEADSSTLLQSGLLLTVCSAANDPGEVELRRQKFPEAIAEDMEAFSVALAARLHGLKTTVVRGVSNVAGDRDHANWKIAEAMHSAVDCLLTLQDRGNNF